MSALITYVDNCISKYKFFFNLSFAVLRPPSFFSPPGGALGLNLSTCSSMARNEMKVLHKRSHFYADAAKGKKIPIFVASFSLIISNISINNYTQLYLLYIPR